MAYKPKLEGDVLKDLETAKQVVKRGLGKLEYSNISFDEREGSSENPAQEAGPTKRYLSVNLSIQLTDESA